MVLPSSFIIEKLPFVMISIPISMSIPGRREQATTIPVNSIWFCRKTLMIYVLHSICPSAWLTSNLPILNRSNFSAVSSEMTEIVAPVSQRAMIWLRFGISASKSSGSYASQKPTSVSMHVPDYQNGWLSSGTYHLLQSIAHSKQRDSCSISIFSLKASLDDKAAGHEMLLSI